MNEQLDRAQLETAKVLLLNEREEVQQALTKASLAAALPGGNEEALEAAEDRLRRIDHKLAGLAYGIREATRQENEREEVRRAAHRLEEAEELWSVTYARGWATQELDEALDAVDAAWEKIEALGHSLVFHAHNVFGDDENGLRLFLLDAHASGITDTSYKLRQDFGRETKRYGGPCMMSLPRARKALGRIVPEALEKAFQDRALAAARRASEAPKDGDGEEPLAA